MNVQHLNTFIDDVNKIMLNALDFLTGRALEITTAQNGLHTMNVIF